MARLAGKVAVITGGSSGIGLATAQRFVDEGAHVFIMSRRRNELDKAKALIGDGLSTVAGDVTNSADLDKLFATVLDTEVGLDILVANSAWVEPEMLGKITEENFDDTFNLNARATLFTVQKALPLIRIGGSVILIGSAAGSMGIPGNSAYSATKAALRSYTRTWTREFNDRGIRFNTLSPGPIDTPMLDRQPDKAQYAAAVPLNRLGRPEEIAAAALFWPPMTAASWPASNWASMVAWHRSNHRASLSTSSTPAVKRLSPETRQSTISPGIVGTEQI